MSTNSIAFTPSTSSPQTSFEDRPSVSYWQDSISRFQKNRRSTFSGLFVLFLILFATIGPFMWSIDPTLQDVSQISQPPWADRSVTIIQEDSNNREAPKHQIDSFQFVGQPNTKVVNLQWPITDNNATYQLYRSIVPISGDQALGLPLAKLASGENHFSDKLNLKPKTYYYSLVTNQENSGSKKLFTISVKPKRVLFLDYYH